MAETEAGEEGKSQHLVHANIVPDVDAGTVPDVDDLRSNVNIWYDKPDDKETFIYEGGEGKKELGFIEVITMLQLRYDDCTSDEERVNPQKGVWFYERTAQMRRHFKRQYPEFFAPKSDRSASKKRQERRKEAEETTRDRKRRGRSTGKIPAVRPEVIDIQAYRERSGS